MAFANSGVGDGIMEVVSLTATIALIALFLNRSKETVDIAQGVGGTYFNGLSMLIGGGSGGGNIRGR